MKHLITINACYSTIFVQEVYIAITIFITCSIHYLFQGFPWIETIIYDMQAWEKLETESLKGQGFN